MISSIVQFQSLASKLPSLHLQPWPLPWRADVCVYTFLLNTFTWNSLLNRNMSKIQELTLHPKPLISSCPSNSGSDTALNPFAPAKILGVSLAPFPSSLHIQTICRSCHLHPNVCLDVFSTLLYHDLKGPPMTTSGFCPPPGFHLPFLCSSHTGLFPPAKLFAASRHFHWHSFSLKIPILRRVFWQAPSPPSGLSSSSDSPSEIDLPRQTTGLNTKHKH